MEASDPAIELKPKFLQRGARWASLKLSKPGEYVAPTNKHTKKSVMDRSAAQKVQEREDNDDVPVKQETLPKKSAAIDRETQEFLRVEQKIQAQSKQESPVKEFTTKSSLLEDVHETWADHVTSVARIEDIPQRSQVTISPNKQLQSAIVKKFFNKEKPQPAQNTPKMEKKKMQMLQQQKMAEMEEKIQKLNEELDFFKLENERIKKQRDELLIEKKKLSSEKTEFSRYRDLELKKLEQVRDSEMKRIARERKVLERQTRANSMFVHKKDVEKEIETLKTMFQQANAENRSKETKLKQSMERLKKAYDEAQERIQELEGDIKSRELQRIDALFDAKKIRKSPNLSIKSTNKTTISPHEQTENPQEVITNMNPITPKVKQITQLQATEAPSFPTTDKFGECTEEGEEAEHEEMTHMLESDVQGTNELEDDDDEGWDSDNEKREENEEPSLQEFWLSDHVQRLRVSFANHSEENEIDEEIAKEMPPKVIHRSQLDGGKNEVQFQDGRKKIEYPNGTVKTLYSNGFSTVAFNNGDTKKTYRSGKVIYYYATADTTHTTYPNGLEVFEFSNAQVERHYPDGTKEILFPDGTEKYIHPSGEEQIVFIDGTVQVITGLYV